MRLNKYIAQCGIASRRKADELISSKRVQLNGVTVTELGVDVKEGKDIVKIDGKSIQKEDRLIYVLLNKPCGYVTTVKDQFGRKSVIDLVKDIDERIYPIGRLDYDTSGLLLLTNDGELTYKLTHPKHEITKTYVAKVKGVPTEVEIAAFKNGLEIEDYITARAGFEILKKEKNTTLCEVKIHEGRNRQVRKMCDKIGHPVISLMRVKMGTLSLGKLQEGKWRHLNEEEVRYLKNNGGR